MIDPRKFALQIGGHHDIIVLVLAKVELDATLRKPLERDFVDCLSLAKTSYLLLPLTF